MRIVHFLNHTRRANGHVNVAVDLACEQARQGHCVWMLGGDSDFEQVLDRYGVKQIFLPVPAERDFRAFVQFAKATAQLRRELVGIRPDIVHTHMPFSSLLAWTAGFSRTWRTVSTVHNSFDRQSLLMALSDTVVCVSSAVEEIMAARGIPRRKLTTVWNGTRGSARLSSSLPDQEALTKPAIVTVSGLHPRKGVFDLITAFDQVVSVRPEANLYIVGSGPSKEELRAQAQRGSAAGRIHFLGHREDPRGVLRAADVFVLASHSDPFPLVILEALDAGVPVIATSVDGIPEALDHGRAGCLVPPKNPRKMAEAMLAVLDNPQRRSALEQAAVERSLSFSVQKMTGDYIQVYQRTIDRA